MNLIDAVVTEVQTFPYEKYGKWLVQVEYDCWGRKSTQTLMFDTRDEAGSVSEGYEFLT